MSEGSWDTGPGDPYRPTLKFKVKDKLVSIMPPPALSCTLCKKQFAQYVHLQQHSRSHSGRRPFKCHPCEQKFLQLTHLKKHRLVKHEAKKKCHACGIYLRTRVAMIRHIIQSHGVSALKLPKFKHAKSSPVLEKPRLAIKLCIKKSVVKNEENSEDNSWKVKKRKKHKKHKKESRRAKHDKNSSSDVSSKSKPRLILKFKMPKDSADSNLSKPAGQSADSFQSSSEQKFVSSGNSANKPEQFSELVQSPSPKDSGIDDCSPLHETDHHENNHSNAASTTTKTSPLMVKSCKVSTSVSSAMASSPALSPRHGRATRQDIALRNLMLEKDSGSFNHSATASESDKKVKRLRSSQSAKAEPHSNEEVNSSAHVDEKVISSPSPVPSLKLKISKKPSGKLRGAKYTSSLQVSTEEPVSPCSAISRSPRSTPAASPRLSKMTQSPVSRKCIEQSSSPRTVYASDFGQLDLSLKKKKSPRQDGKGFGRSPRYMRMESTDTVSSYTSEPPSLSSAHSFKSESDFCALNVHVDDPYAFDDSPCSTSPHLLPYTSTLPKRTRPLLEPPVLEPQIMPITSANQDSKPKNKLLSMKKGRAKTYLFGHNKEKSNCKLNLAKEKNPKRLKVTQCPRPTGLKPLLKSVKGFVPHKDLLIQKDSVKAIIQSDICPQNSCETGSIASTPSTISVTVSVSNSTNVLCQTSCANDLTTISHTATTSCIVSPVENRASPSDSMTSDRVVLQCAAVSKNAVFSQSSISTANQVLTEPQLACKDAIAASNVETVQLINAHEKLADGHTELNSVLDECSLTKTVKPGTLKSVESTIAEDNGSEASISSSKTNDINRCEEKLDRTSDIKDSIKCSAVQLSEVSLTNQIYQRSVFTKIETTPKEDQNTSPCDKVNDATSITCDQVIDSKQASSSVFGCEKTFSSGKPSPVLKESQNNFAQNVNTGASGVTSDLSLIYDMSRSKRESVSEICTEETLNESDLLLSDNQLANISFNDSFLKLADDEHGDDFISNMDVTIDNLSNNVDDSAYVNDRSNKKKVEADAIVVQLPSEMGMEPMSFTIDNDDSDNFGEGVDGLDLQSSLSSAALPSLAASNISEVSSVGHSSASSVSSLSSRPIKQPSQQEVCLASLDTDSEFAELQTSYSPSQNNAKHACKGNDDHHASGFFDAFANFVESKQTTKSLSHGYDSEFARFISQKSAISVDSDAISNLEESGISKTELQALSESHKKVHSLCSDVWRLLRSLFPALEVPSYMRGSSACATEVLIDQVLDMINDEDPSRTHILSGPHTCCEPSISVCLHPSRCLSHIRSRVSQLLLALLPDLSLPADFFRTGSDVDELLRHVIQTNVT